MSKPCLGYCQSRSQVPGQNIGGDVLSGDLLLCALLQRVLDLPFDDVTVGGKLFRDRNSEQKSGLGLDQLRRKKKKKRVKNKFGAFRGSVSGEEVKCVRLQIT